MIIFESERLVFKEFKENDFSLFYSVFSNELVMRYALADQYLSQEEAKPFFNRLLHRQTLNKERHVFEYAVYLKKDNTFIGFADFEIHFQNQAGGWAEIGYFLLPEFWGKGYATEIGKAQITHIFETFNIHKIQACCNVNNNGSEKIMQKSGMIKEGELRAVRYKYGKWVNEYRYGILKDEWEKSRK